MLRLLPAWAGLILLAGLVAACAPAATPTPVPTPRPTATPTPPPEPFRLGVLDLGLVDLVMNSVADPASQSGPATRSLLLAVKQVNAAGGVWGQPVAVHFADTFEGTAADHAGRLLAEAGVHAFVGPARSESLAEVAAAIAIPQQIPFIGSVSTVPYIADLADDGFIFRTALSNLAEGQALALLAAAAGYDHVALAHRDDPWGNALAGAFKAHFAGRVSEVALHPGRESYAEELHQIAASKAPALAILNFHDDAAAVLAEVAEHGHFEEVLLHGDLRAPDLAAQFPAVLAGAKGVAPTGKHVTEAEGHWEADYAAEYGDLPPGLYMRETYDAAVALMLAAEYAGSADGAAIRDALYLIGNPPGQRFPASAEGIKGALAAIRSGGDIDLEGEATDLNWDDRGEIVTGHMGVWQFQEGAIVDLNHFDVDLSQ